MKTRSKLSRNRKQITACYPSSSLSKLVLLALIAFSSFTQAEQASDQFAPEQSHQVLVISELNINSTQYRSEFIAVTAHPLASKAAYEILEEGGSSIDAMVTALTVLGLVEPQSSGLGGGAFTVYYDAERNRLSTYDGRETAPFASTEDLFMSNETTPMQFFDAVVGGRSVGTPGAVKLLWELHNKYGILNWSRVLSPAIELAEEGFKVTPRLAYSVARDASRLKYDSETAKYFFPENIAIKAGDILKNPAYADTLKQLAKHGGDYFYNSEISKAIIDKVNRSKNKGLLNQKDFDAYQIIEREPVCSNFYEFEVCGMGPPSSGGITVSQILSMVEYKNIRYHTADQAKTWQIIAESSRLAFADRGQYLADPNFFNVPKGLLNKTYLMSRSQLIVPMEKNKNLSFGIPPDADALKLQTGNSPEQESTSHFVLVDKKGNIVSTTSTIENAFGSRLMVKGFLLNNELTDFSFRPTKQGHRVANRVEPGKRPRSSMSPTIVFQNEEPYLALGSPGGSRIINFVAHSLIRVLAWQESLQHAFDQPHVINRFGRMEIEKATYASDWEQFFVDLNYDVSVQDINSGLHGVHFTKRGMLGAADKRREGVVLGK